MIHALQIATGFQREGIHTHNIQYSQTVCSMQFVMLMKIHFFIFYSKSKNLLQEDNIATAKQMSK